MANTIQLKRRVSGNAGAPAALKSGELAHNEVDDTLYVGKGDDGSGNATTILPLGGRGAFMDLGNSQTIAGAKTFSLVPKSAQDASAATDLVRKSQFDGGLAGKAEASHGHAIGDVSGLQTALDGKSDGAHGHVIADVTGLQTALNGKAPPGVTCAERRADRTDAHIRHEHDPDRNHSLRPVSPCGLWGRRHAQGHL